MITGLAYISSGCVSQAVYKGSENKIATRRAVLTNNENAIEVLRRGDGAKDAGIEVPFMDVIKERPVAQAGAALADAGIVWLGYESAQWLTDRYGNTDRSEDQGDVNVNITVTNCQDNDIQVRDDSVTTK